MASTSRTCPRAAESGSPPPLHCASTLPSAPPSTAMHVLHAVIPTGARAHALGARARRAIGRPARRGVTRVCDVTRCPVFHMIDTLTRESAFGRALRGMVHGLPTTLSTAHPLRLTSRPAGAPPSIPVPLTVTQRPSPPAAHSRSDGNAHGCSQSRVHDGRPAWSPASGGSLRERPRSERREVHLVVDLRHRLGDQLRGVLEVRRCRSDAARPRRDAAASSPARCSPAARP